MKYSVRPRYFYSFIDALSEIARIEILYALTTAWAKLYLKSWGTPLTIVGYHDSTAGDSEFPDGNRSKGRFSRGDTLGTLG